MTTPDQQAALPNCGDEFDGNTCELPAGHSGHHRQEIEVGTLEWSDPISGDTPDGPCWDIEDEEHDEDE